MKLRPLALGLTLGIVWGSVVMLATWWLLLIGTRGRTMSLLGNFYIGYEVSWVGSLIGLAWGFVDGCLIGLVTALLYNYFSREKGQAAAG